MIRQHGRNQLQARPYAQHGKRIACPFDTRSPEWREWRNGFCDELVMSSPGCEVIRAERY